VRFLQYNMAIASHVYTMLGPVMIIGVFSVVLVICGIVSGCVTSDDFRRKPKTAEDMITNRSAEQNLPITQQPEAVGTSGGMGGGAGDTGAGGGACAGAGAGTGRVMAGSGGPSTQTSSPHSDHRVLV
jgi:hypothetical protein